MTSLSKKVYTYKLDDIVNKYNNVYHSTTSKMKHVDIKLSTFVIIGVENNNKDPKFETGYRERISKYKNILAKGCVPNWCKEDF